MTTNRQNGAAVKRTLATIAMLSLIGAACGTASDQDAAPVVAAEGGVLPEVSVSVGVAELSELPLDDDRLVWDVREALVSQCMTEVGLDYPPLPYPEEGNKEVLAIASPDPELVAEFGYDWRAELTPPLPQTAEERFEGSDAQAAEFVEALSSCFDGAVVDLGQDRFAVVRMNLLTADAEILQETMLDDRVAATEQRWSTCMADGGKDFKDPGEARDSVGLETRSPEATSIAVADFECRDSSGLTTTINSVRAELSSDWLAQNALVVSEFVDERDLYVTNARGIAPSLGVED